MPEQYKTYYQILGVKFGASKKEVEEAYFKLAKTCHPDIAGDDTASTEKFMLINEAYQVLSTPEKRDEYDRTIGLDKDWQAMAKATPDVAVSTTDSGAIKEEKRQRTTGAQTMASSLRKVIKNADRLCREANFWNAYDLLQKWLVKYPHQPALRRALARAAVGKMRYHDAADHLLVACEVEYFNADNHALLGKVYIKGKQWQKAEDAFNNALSWNSEHKVALANLEIVKKHFNDKNSLLGNVMGKLGFRKKDKK